MIVLGHEKKEEFLGVEVETTRNMIYYFPILIFLYFVHILSNHFQTDIVKCLFVDFGSKSIVTVTHAGTIKFLAYLCIIPYQFHKIIILFLSLLSYLLVGRFNIELKRFRGLFDKFLAKSRRKLIDGLVPFPLSPNQTTTFNFIG